MDNNTVSMPDNSYELKNEKPINIAKANIHNDTMTIFITFLACSSSFFVCVTFLLFLPIFVSFKVQR